MTVRVTATGALLALGACLVAHAQQTVVSEDFTRGTTANSWFFYDGACLTAGGATGVEPTGMGPGQGGQIPGCATPALQAYYNEPQVGGWNGVAGNTATLPDPLIAPSVGPGEGALRFTNGSPGGYRQNGQIVSNWTFGSGQGLQLTFMTVSYRGDGNGYYGATNATNPGDGADGMSFFLTDAAQPFLPGAWGGGLGYSCSNTNPPYDGMTGAYLAVGMDEWGNFLNGSQPMPGWVNPNPNPVSGDNTALGYGARPDRIGLRGQGNVNWAYLTQTYGSVNPSYAVSPYYPVSLAGTLDSNGHPYSQDAVQRTCQSGQLWNYANPASPVAASTTPVTAQSPATPVLASDYTPIPNAYVELQETGPDAVHIAAEGAMSRQQAQPIYYQLKLTQNGLLSFSYSLSGPGGVFLQVIKDQDITAPNSSGVPSNGALPAAFRFGFGGSTGGSTNIHEILCFSATDLTPSASGAGASEQQSAKLENGIEAYFSYYDPSNSTGRLTAYSLGTDPTTGAVVINPTADWDAACALTGTGPNGCPTTTFTGPMTAQSPGSGYPGNLPARVILTQNGAQGFGGGMPLEWTGGQSPTTAQQQALEYGDASGNVPAWGQDRINFLRGARSSEIPTTGPTATQFLRKRDSVLGDIENSRPAWVGPPASPYSATWVDRLSPHTNMPENTGSQSYLQYSGSGSGGQAMRLNVVYVGSNDGMMHGFRAGAFNADGSFDTSAPNDGLEVLAYMPNNVVQRIHDAINPATAAYDPSIDFTGPRYGHNFFVDATPGSGDLFYGGAWHTWLVSGQGAGGSAIFALDITNPGIYSGGTAGAGSFAESNAANLVLGEWSSSSISCPGNATCGTNLGNTYGTPQIRRLHNGQWGVIFGNGYASSSNDAGIFIMLVDPHDPLSTAPTFYYLSTASGSSCVTYTGGISTVSAAGSSTSPNGIASVTPVDLDSDHVSDYVYAGDLQGNLWRFDLTSSTAGNWAVTCGGPLFKTQPGQPITTAAVAASGLAGGTMQQRLMIVFGTGQKNPATNQSAVSYATGQQDLYGIWDWNLGYWNSQSATQYASLPALPSGVSGPLTQASLAGETVTINTSTGRANGNRDINTNAAICWAGTTTCGTSASANLQFGWYLPPPATTSINGATMSWEQFIHNPQLLGQAVVINSILPASNAATSCQINADQGWTYGVAALTGGALTNAFPQYYDTVAAGVPTSATGMSLPVENVTRQIYLVYQTVFNTHGVTQFNPGANASARRLTWIQRR